MHFLYPGFLFGLLALAVPLVIHLFHFRRFRTVWFTNVRFLRNIREETATKNRLKHLLVLIARMLAIAFLVFAFAQPYLPAIQSGDVKQRNAVSIYIDNSFSMEAVQDDEQLLDIAKRKAEEIASAYSIDDKFQLLTNDMEAKHQRLLSKEECMQMIRQVRVSPQVRTQQEIFNRQLDLLSHEQDARKIVYSLSDFQINNGASTEDTTVQHYLVYLKSSENRNMTVDSLWFTSPVLLLSQQAKLCIRVQNYGDEEMRNAPVTLNLNGQVKSLTNLDIPAHSAVIDTLAFTLQDARWQKGVVNVRDYPVAFDDDFFFSFKPVDKVPVLCINNGNENPFLRSVYGNKQTFVLQNNSFDQIDFATLNNYPSVVLQNTTTISSGLAQALQKQLDNGGNVILFPSDNMDVSSVNTFLNTFHIGSFAVKNTQRKNVSKANVQLDILSDVFEKIPGNLALPYATLSYPIQTSSRSLQEQIMTFADGTPMLARYPVANGYVYLSSVPLNTAYTDLPLQSSWFVALMYKIAVSAHKGLPVYAVIGTDKWFPLRDFAVSGDNVIKVKGADDEFIPEMRKSGNTVEINCGNYIQDAGSYSVEGVSATNSKPLELVLSLNYDRRESDLRFYTEDALRDMYAGDHTGLIDNVHQDLSGLVNRLSTGTPLWKFCVIFVLVFLAAEILLIRLLP
ncbi:MAG: BatA domain-containing protein [Chitinophagales bacterium]